MYQLRDYQIEAVKTAQECLKGHKNGIIVMPTGSGKSWIIAEISNQIEGNVIVLQPTKEILEQNVEKILMVDSSADVGVYSASMNRKDTGNITFATIGSVVRHKEIFENYELIIVDECHAVNSKGGMYEDFINSLGLQTLGLTATPFRLRHYRDFRTGDTVAESHILTRTRPRIFAKIIHVTQIKDLFEQNYLCPLDYDWQNDYNSIDIKSNSTNQGYDDSALKKYNESYGITNRIVDSVETSGSKHCLAFCQFTDESKDVVMKLRGKGIMAAEVSATTDKKEREEIVRKFRSGQIRCVVNVNVFSCLLDDTEILTDKGWVGIDDIKKIDKVAQYDIESQFIDFSQPIAIIKKDVPQDYKMIEVDGRYVSFTVTNDHDLLATTSHRENAKFQKAKAQSKIGKKFVIPVSGFSKPKKIIMEQKKITCSKERFINYNSYNYRKKGMTNIKAMELAEKLWIKKNNLKYKSPSELSLDECRFIGFWIGDGSKNKGKSGGTAYTLCQSRGTPKMLLWIEKILLSCKIHYSSKDYKGGANFICGNLCNTNGHRTYLLSIGTGGHKQSFNGLYSLMPYLEKDGTKLFWGLNRGQYFALMEGLWKADGVHKDNLEYKGGVVAGKHKKLFDLLQAIGVCRGFRTTVKPLIMRKYNKVQLYGLSLCDKQKHQITNNRPKEIIINENGRRVWCVTMPKGTIVTRKKGTVTIMGNCGFDFPGLDSVIIGRPTKSLKVYYQMIGRGVRTAPGKSSCKIYDLCDNVKRFGKIESFEFEDVNGNGMWRLKSDIGYVTGVDIVTGKDLEKKKRRVTPKDKKEVKSGEFKITFGKHAGKAIAEVGIDYLKWCVENFDDGRLKALFATELEKRESQNTKKQDILL